MPDAQYYERVSRALRRRSDQRLQDDQRTYGDQHTYEDQRR